ncbi:MAG: choice-of-anchor J domain-containing protein, partial [Candidatus Delongbacteria bacterium]|nr:choice-of-anchor J domain-containing protein [Candidatus Delongbacteria bacterium]
SPVGTAADDFYNIQYVDPALILVNDFFVSVVPLSEGNPRLVSSYEVNETHSLYGTPGIWNGFQSGGEYFEWAIDFGLSPYGEIDSYPPIVRNLTGLENFESTDAELILAVQDINTVVTPMLGQYNLGSGWVDFNLVQAKGTYTFTGSVPGQPDGTTALVKFYMEDRYGNAQWSKDYEIIWSKDTPFISESFEGAFPPAGWTLNTSATGNGFVRGTAALGAVAHTGEASLTHFYAGDNDDWIYTPAITIPADNFSMFSFWQNGFWMTYGDLHEVSVSADSGTSWTQIYTGLPTSTAENADEGIWEQLSFSLAAYEGEEIIIGFHYRGNESDDWFIDDVEVYYDYAGPEIVSLIGNEALLPTVGAYVNNDLVINATVYDRSGIASVTGHYSFDGGTTVIDLPFAKAKSGNEAWTATIPAEAASVTGTINFDMVDIGGLTSTSIDFPIEFVIDIDVPVIKAVKNRLAFINDPMNLEVVFEDESYVFSCKGHYSKDGWVTQYDFVMSPSKIHEYTYTGTIPAESEQVLDGEVRFTIVDSASNTLNTDSYTVQWLNGQTLFTEDFESGLGNWTLTGNWGLEEGTYTSATHALTESPDSNYTDNNISYAAWSNTMDWTMYYKGSIEFWCKYDLENDYDFMHFECSGDNGATWTRLRSWSGEGADWHEELISMSEFVGYSQVIFRFMFVSDGAVNLNGMYIDDLLIKTQNTPVNPPIIIHDGPVHYEGASHVEDYNSSAKILDFSGIDSTRVYYQINGGQEQESEMLYAGDDTWNFSIPFTTVGNIVSYRIWARDASPHYEETITDFYTYISGDHLIYDSDITSYYMIAENNNAYAVRMTADDSDSDRYLPFILIRNYYDASHISDSMEVHVWSDFGGLPGDELIDPVMVLPGYLGGGAPYTKIDLRTEFSPFGIMVSGDFWVGFSAPYGSVYALTEAPNEESTIAYGRSYKGTWNEYGTGWLWLQEPDYNYHIRAVIGDRVGIDEQEIVPEITALHQNYPNPFNPVTKIQFDIAEDSDVSLAVFDVSGRKVADLVNKKMQAGSHSVEFEASKLSSGVYYYSLKAGKSVQTKKMVLLR